MTITGNWITASRETEACVTIASLRSNNDTLSAWKYTPHGSTWIHIHSIACVRSVIFSKHCHFNTITAIVDANTTLSSYCKRPTFNNNSRVYVFKQCCLYYDVMQKERYIGMYEFKRWEHWDAIWKVKQRMQGLVVVVIWMMVVEADGFAWLW